MPLSTHEREAIDLFAELEREIKAGNSAAAKELATLLNARLKGPEGRQTTSDIATLANQLAAAFKTLPPDIQELFDPGKN